MSNALAVPAVTAALTSIVQNAVDRLGINPGPVVAPGPLDDAGDNARVGVHLYRVTRNADLANADLPTRSGSGQLRARPQAAIDLHYLFTFRGNSEWESQQLLATTAAALHSVTSLSAARLAQAEVDHGEIGGNDLADADEPVRICADSLSIDEITRFWALFAPGSFSVTLGISAGPVLVDADGDVGAGLPVRRVGLGVRTFDGPRLDSVAGPDGIGAPVQAASPMPDLTLRGAGLSKRPGETVEVLLDGVAAAAIVAVDDTEITVTSPELLPGRHRVQVRRLGPPLEPSSTTPTAQVSDAVDVIVVPTLGTLAKSTHAGSAAHLRSGTVTADLVPAVDHTHRVRLLLDIAVPDPNQPPPTAVVLGVDIPDDGNTHGTLVFPVTDAHEGQYRVTLEIDGVRSIPPLDVNGAYVLPVVTL
jgi:hypothetical protein